MAELQTKDLQMLIFNPVMMQLIAWQDSGLFSLTCAWFSDCTAFHDLYKWSKYTFIFHSHHY